MEAIIGMTAQPTRIGRFLITAVKRAGKFVGIVSVEAECPRYPHYFTEGIAGKGAKAEAFQKARNWAECRVSDEERGRDNVL